MPMTPKQIQMLRDNTFPFPKKPKERSDRAASENERKATHTVNVDAPGCGTGVDMDIFCAAGVYSDSSGCMIGTGDRDHQFLVKDLASAQAMKERILKAAKWLDTFNGKVLGITVTITKR